MGFDPALLHPATAGAAQAAAAFIRKQAGEEPIRFALVLGTGLGPLADEASDAVGLSFGDIPHFPASGVTGHAGKLVIGRLSGQRVAILQGRVHYYERGDAGAMRIPLETFALLGAGTVILTNSAGVLRPDYKPPTLVVMSDHINWTGLNPLIGDPSDARFVNMVDAYDPELRARLRRVAAAEGIALPEGVYAWYSGPSFETPAEIRMARIMGADLVGMSTVPEVILARRLGLKVAAISMATNFGAGMDEREVISHAQTKAMALKGAGQMQRLIRGFLADF
jgi:purine-nucleoside phosphorylase